MDRTPQPARTGLTERLAPDINRINFTVSASFLNKANHRRHCWEHNQSGRRSCPFSSTSGDGVPGKRIQKRRTGFDHPDAPPTVRTTFLGLYGVDSPLPTAYLDYIAQRRDGHEAMMAFLDILTIALSLSTIVSGANIITLRRLNREPWIIFPAACWG